MRCALIAAICLGSAVGASGQLLEPDVVLNSNLRVQVEKVGSMPFVLGPGFFGPAPNLGSPVVVGNELFLIDQNDAIYRTQGNKVFPVLQVGSAPAGLTLENRESILSVAADDKGQTVYVVFTSSTLPSLVTIPVYELPPMAVDPDYHIFPTFYHVLYQYTYKNNVLSDPRAISAFETQFGPTHTGGGMLVLEDGRLLLVLGDGLTFGRDGSFGAQDGTTHVSKMMVVDPANGSYEVVAQGLRNVQRLQYVKARPQDDEPLVAFADIGGVTAEELNVVPLEDLLGGGISNFGWGRNPDGLAREGTFYIQSGIALASGEPAVAALAPTPEPGFLQPLAQYGREGSQLAAITGPVISPKSFGTITAFFGDLNGAALAITDGLDGQSVPVYRVNLVDENGVPTTFNTLAGGRSDPRFFLFPDGRAGVLLEKTGELFRLTQIEDLPN